MPFKSEKQRRFFYWAAKHKKHGITPKMVDEWEGHTPKGSLPEKVSSAFWSGFADELDKLAEEKPSPVGEGFLAGTGAMVGHGIGGALSMPLALGVKGTKAPVDVEGLHKQLGTKDLGHVVHTDQPLRSRVMHGDARGAGKYENFLSPAKQTPTYETAVKGPAKRFTAFAPTTQAPEFLAHELGHVAVRRSPLMAKLLNVGRAGGPLAGAVGAGLLAANEDPDSTAVKAAPLVAAAGMAPTLADEAAASYKGMKALRGLGKLGPQQLSQARGNLLRAFGTYGMAAGGMAAVPALLGARRRRLKAQQAAESEQEV